MTRTLAPVILFAPIDVGNAGGGASGNAGGGSTGTGDAGSSSGNGNGVSDIQGNDPWSGLADTGNRDTVKNKGWKTHDDAVKSYRELETAYSKRHEEVRTFKADEYKIPAPTNLPDGMPYDNKFMTNFVEQAAKIGIAPKQASDLHEWFVGSAASSFKSVREAEVAATKEAVAKAESALTTKWGDPAAETFKRNTDAALRALRMSSPALRSAMVAAGAIKTVDGKDLVADAASFEVLAQIGSAMFKEDAPNNNPTDVGNPFDPKSENTMLQNELVQKNPDKAIALIKAAGPKVYDRNKWWIDAHLAAKK